MKTRKLQVEYVSPSVLKPWENNPRKGTEDAAKHLAKSMEQMGFISPIVATRDGVIRAGHTRIEAAKKLGLSEVPVIFVDFDSEEEAEMFAIADNRLGEFTKWKYDVLGQLLAKQKSTLEQLSSVSGFDKKVIKGIIHQSTGLTHPEDIVERTVEETNIKRGQLIKLGDHRLYCGDATSPSDMSELMMNDKADIVFTDPPYNVNVISRSKESAFHGIPIAQAQREVAEDDKPVKARKLLSDGKSEQDYKIFTTKWINRMAEVMRAGAVVYLWGGHQYMQMYMELCKQNNIIIHQFLVWLKNHPSFTRKDFGGRFESCAYGWKLGEPHFARADISSYTDVWEFDVVPRKLMIHLTEKPIGLALRALDLSSVGGDIVLDLFGGGGSTLLAAEHLGRRARIMELEPLYCQTIVNRWEAITGKEAEYVNPH